MGRQHRIGREPEVRQDPARVIQRLGRYEHALRLRVRAVCRPRQEVLRPVLRVPSLHDAWPVQRPECVAYLADVGALANGTRFLHRTAFAVVVADFVAGGSCVGETGWNLFEEARPGVGEVAAKHA